MKRLSRIFRLPGGIAVCMLGAGCGADYEIRTYVAPRENKDVVSSEALRSQFPGIPFKWKVPDTWRIAENDQFSVSAWETGPAGMEARITLSKLDAAAGLMQQVIRWRTQLNLKTETEEELAGSYREITVGKSTGTFVDISNDTETILGLIVSVNETMWIFKYRAPNATTKQTGDSFQKFVEGLEVADSGQ
ncbi:MAG: hypothetical protein R3C19_16570 [Planctomycetaceae bacterium]